MNPYSTHVSISKRILGYQAFKLWIPAYRNLIVPMIVIYYDLVLKFPY